MFRKILVPLDGSELSERALRLAVPLARRANARLRLISVHAAFPAGSEAEEALQDYLRARVESLRARGVGTDAALLHHDGPVMPRTAPATAFVSATLRHYARIEGIDLIVMTTHGRGQMRRAWLGSVADALVRNSEIPVLLARSVDAAPSPELLRNTVLLAVDGSAVAEEAVGPAIAFAQLGGRHITLIRVVAPPQPPFPAYGEWARSAGDTLERDRHLAETYMTGLAERLRTLDLTVDVDIAIDTPASGILAAARRHHPSVIALATHGVGGVKRVLLGSVADKLIRTASVAVLVVRPGPLQDHPDALDGDYTALPTPLYHEVIDS